MTNEEKTKSHVLKKECSIGEFLVKLCSVNIFISFICHLSWVKKKNRNIIFVHKQKTHMSSFTLHKDCCIWLLTRPSAAFALSYFYLIVVILLVIYNVLLVESKWLLLNRRMTSELLSKSAQTAFAIISFNLLKCCNPIGQFRKMPVANLGFIFFRKKIHVDLPLDLSDYHGKFHDVSY